MGRRALVKRGTFAEGVLCTLAGAILWGFSGSAMQYLLENYHVSTLFVTMVRMLGAGTLFLLIMLATKRDVLARVLQSRADMVRFAIFGAVGLFVCQITYIVTIDFTNAGTATVIQATNIVMVAVVVCAMRRRAPSAFELAGIICASLAIFLISTGGDVSTLRIPLPGLVVGLASAVSVAFYILYPRGLFERYGSMPVTGLGMLAGGAVAALAWVVLSAVGAPSDSSLAHLTTVPTLDAMGVFMLLVIVLVGTFGAFGLNIRGISLVGGMPASMLGAFEPVSAAVLAVIWLGTVFTWADWAGLVLMVATIMLVAWGGRDGQKA